MFVDSVKNLHLTLVEGLVAELSLSRPSNSRSYYSSGDQFLPTKPELGVTKVSEPALFNI